MIRAGINPRGMRTFFDKLLAEEQRGRSNSAASWFSSHPGTRDRMADVDRMLTQIPARTLRSLRTNSQGFQSMKRRLAAQPFAVRASRWSREVDVTNAVSMSRSAPIEALVCNNLARPRIRHPSTIA
jgi:predicted Zn-dependent protease